MMTRSLPWFWFMDFYDSIQGDKRLSKNAALAFYGFATDDERAELRQRYDEFAAAKEAEHSQRQKEAIQRDIVRLRKYAIEKRTMGDLDAAHRWELRADYMERNDDQYELELVGYR